MKLKFIIDDENSGKTVKHILKNKMHVSERLLKKLRDQNKIFLSSAPVYVTAAVSAGDNVEVVIDFEEECEDIIPEDIPIDIIYEDGCIIALNKQPNIVVHPTCSHPAGTIANAVMHHFQKNGIKKKIRPVSRLDRDTSGIILFAKNQYVQEFLIRQMNENLFVKEYIGIVHGTPEDKTGTINLPIERKPGSIMLRHISPYGYPSITHFEVIEYLNNASFLKFHLETGRTHQIRVHCQAIGHPLIGDTLYSDVSTNLIGRQALHSCKVSFIHPLTKDRIDLYAPIPDDINSLLESLKI